ncbi:MSHA biogenesis protein MshK [Vibrio rarus]
MLLLTLGFGQIAYAQQDPTAPLGWYSKKSSSVAKVKTYALPTLQSVVCDEGAQCFAMLNDNILSEGQSIAGYHVKKITSQRVTLARNGKVWHLALFNSDVRQ